MPWREFAGLIGQETFEEICGGRETAMKRMKRRLEELLRQEDMNCVVMLVVI